MPVPDCYEFSSATPTNGEGGYRLELPTRRLLKDGQPLSLTPKAFDVLLALIERRDRVVEKTELMRLIWADSFVEEANLSQTIFVLRKTLGDDAAGRRFIDTIPRRGYRFVAPVREPAPAGAAAVVVEADQQTAPNAAVGSEAKPVHRRGTAWWAAVSVAALAVLTWLGASRPGWWNGNPSPIESLVVLPFENLSGDPEQDYLADGITDAVITSLGHIRGLRVISRTSAMAYRGTHKTLPEIAMELAVDGVVEGAVQRDGSRLRLNVKLIDASTDRSLWTESYEGDLHDVIGLHNEVARAVAGRTGVALSPQETARLAEPSRVNPEVLQAYLKGRYFWSRRSEPDVRKAIDQFESALRIDPSYAPAWAGLADCYAIFASYGWAASPRGEWTKALEAANRAVALDESLSDGHTSRARIALSYELDWEKTGQGYRRALELNPGYANAHHWYGYYLLLAGRLQEGEAQIRRALELDPLSPVINANVGMAIYMDRRYDAAVAHWRSALELHPHYGLLHNYLAMAYLQTGRYPEAVAEIQRASALPGAGSWEMSLLAYAYAQTGNTDAAREQLTLLLDQPGPPAGAAYHIAIVYVGLGDNDNAFAWLNKAVEERSGSFNEVNADPMFDRLRPDPRFTVLLQRMGLPVVRSHQG